VFHTSNRAGDGASRSGEPNQKTKGGYSEGRFVMTKTATRNVFVWLDQIRSRPGMYIRNNSLRELEMLIWGYYSALGMHGIVEDVPAMDRHFSTWLGHTTKWSCCSGWAYAINYRFPVADDALNAFFRLVDEYRRLRPTRLCTVELGPRNNPTGKQVVIGFNGRIDKPHRVDIIRYRPTHLHFLRFYYENRIIDRDPLMKGTGSHATSLEFAKSWVRDELQVELDRWEPCPRQAI
jgi:hypothetical protein